ncbi:MAG: acylphosphatase [Chloroflexi bacterium]|nr:MAG: acylphosphatase [Chloroflexota bacterium]
MKRIIATVHGIVQGVSFREYTRREATRLRLTGWVANQPDGTVKVVAEGAEAALQQLVQWLRRGPPAARVDQVEVVWSETTGEFHQFGIRW